MRKLLELPGKGKRRKTVSRKYFSRFEFNYGLSRVGFNMCQVPDPIHFAIMLAPQFYSTRLKKSDGLLVETNEKHTANFVPISASGIGSTLSDLSCLFYMQISQRMQIFSGPSLMQQYLGNADMTDPE
jgi:hypothetical protein